MFNPEDPRDAEELLNYLDSLESDDECFQQFQGAESLEIVSLPPNDGRDSDIDDAVSDEEIVPGIRDLGKGLLAQKVEILSVNKQNEKNPTTVSSRNNPTESSDDSDGETLADKQKRMERGGLFHSKR